MAHISKKCTLCLIGGHCHIKIFSGYLIGYRQFMGAIFYSGFQLCLNSSKRDIGALLFEQKQQEITVDNNNRGKNQAKKNIQVA